MEPWNTRFPERLTEEREALRAIGATVEDQPRTGDGLVRWLIELPLARFDLPAGHPLPDPLRIQATFPGSFPYLRPEVNTVSDLVFPRHQHPFGKNLCLLPRRTLYWDSDTLLADLLLTQLPVLVARAAEEDFQAILNIEGEQPEPFTDYYPYVRPSGVFVPDSAEQLELPECGVLHISILPNLAKGIRAVVTAIQTKGGLLPFDLPSNLLDQYGRRTQIPFVRLDRPIASMNAEDGLSELVGRGTPLKLRRTLKVKEGEVRLGAVVFPEESVHGYTNGWVFLAKILGRGKGASQRSLTANAHYVRGERIGMKALAARMPGLSGIGANTVALVGLGAIGAPIALGLARAGTGMLRIMDGDTVDAGTIRRWPFGFPAVGYPKTSVLKGAIESHYPFTSVTAVEHTIGSTYPSDRPEHQVMTEFMEGVDILVDASAEWGVSHFLSDLARGAQIPYVRAFATPGAWGGEITVVAPGSDACWGCVYAAQQSGEIVFPPSAPERQGQVQPVGCADPTFIGAGFDIEPISTQAVRTVVSTLSRGEAGAYPRLPWEVAILSLVDHVGTPIPPTWRTYALTRHPQCSGHQG